jgi:hypothetical protein
MKPFVRDRRDEIKIVAATLTGCLFVFAGETISELAYLPLYAFLRRGVRLAAATTEEEGT